MLSYHDLNKSSNYEISNTGAGSFDDDMNGWLPDMESAVGIWERTTGQDGFTDHTTGKGGSYIEVETIKLKRRDFASLVSPNFASSDNGCKMSLYYAIWGTNTVGNITLHLRTANGDILLWNVAGNGNSVSVTLRTLESHSYTGPPCKTLL